MKNFYSLLVLFTLFFISKLYAAEPVVGYTEKPFHVELDHLTIEQQQARKQRESIFFKDFFLVQLNDDSLSEFHQKKQNKAQGSLESVSSKVYLHNQESQSYITQIKAKQDTFKHSASTLLNKEVSFTNQYQLILNGVTLRLSNDEKNKLVAHPQVKSIQKFMPHYVQTSVSTDLIQADQVWKTTSEQTGNRGEGVTVGIIDTGIASLHPSFSDVDSEGYHHNNPLGENQYLGQCQQYPSYCNDKVIGMVTYPQLIEHAKQEYKRLEFNDNDLLDRINVGYDITGHGSHTASTASGNSVDNAHYYLDINKTSNETEYIKSNFNFDVSGVAPRSNIVSYQVCDFFGLCYPNLTIEALEHAIANGIDVINYSIGGSPYINPWSDPSALAFLNARFFGLHVATSAGNLGPIEGSVGSPGNAPWLTSVAAYSHGRTHTPNELVISDGNSELLRLQGEGISNPVAITGIIIAKKLFELGCDTNFSEQQFNGEIVVCQGNIYQYHIEKALKAGASAVVAINEEYPRFQQAWLSYAFIEFDQDTGNQLLDLLEGNSELKAEINGVNAEIDYQNADIGAIFSSKGPNLINASIASPHIAAPGINVIAAVAEETPFNPFVQDIPPYQPYSGTSMASPHIAGAMALIKAIHPDWTPAQMQSALMTTAKIDVSTEWQVIDNIISNAEVRQSNAMEAGAGRVQILDAIDATLLLDESVNGYLDADPIRDAHAPTKINMSSLFDSHCFVSCSWTRTVTAAIDGEWNVEVEQLDNNNLDIEVSPAKFSLIKGQSQEITVKVNHVKGQLHQWQFANIKLVHNDKTKPISRLNVAVKFNAGTAPKVIKREINRSTGPFYIRDIVTSGAEKLEVNVSGLYKAKSLFGQTNNENGNFGSFEAIVNATDSEREAKGHFSLIELPEGVLDLIIQMKSWQSKHHKRIYIALDYDENDVPSIDDILACTFDTRSQSSCSLPIFDWAQSYDFWLYVEGINGSGGGVPSVASQQVNTDSDFIDEHHIEVLTPIKQGGISSVNVNSPLQNLIPNESYTIQLDYEGVIEEDNSLKALEVGSLYFANVELGTSKQESNNITNVLVELQRGQDDVVLSTEATHASIGDNIYYNVAILPNKFEHELNYSLSLTLPENVELDIGSVTGEGTVDGTKVVWEVRLPQGESTTLNFRVAVISADEKSQVNMQLTNSVDLLGTVTELAHALPVLIGMPNALINGEEHFEANYYYNEHIEFLASVDNSGLNNSFDFSNPDFTYNWKQTGGSVVDLNIQTDKLIFKLNSTMNTQPDVLQFELVANDGDNDSVMATANITIQEYVNITPVASASSFSIEEGLTVTLDGSNSSDGNGDVLVYSWQGPGTISDNASAITNVEGLNVGSHEFTLTVNDGSESDSISITVTITEKPVVIPPEQDDKKSSGGSGSGFLILLLLTMRMINSKKFVRIE